MAKEPVVEKKRRGRTSPYHPVYAPRIAGLLAARGVLDRDIAKELGIKESAFYAWRKRYPEFDKAIVEGKEVPDDQVEAALFKSATGYFVEEVHQARDGGGNVVSTTMSKRWVAPAIGAQCFWLKNRRKDVWKDRHDVEISIESDPLVQFAIALNEFKIDHHTSS